MRKLQRLNAPVEDWNWTWHQQADQSELPELSSQSATTEQLTCPVQKSPAWPLQFLEIWWDQTCGMCARTLNKRYSTTVTKYISNLRLDFEIESNSFWSFDAASLEWCAARSWNPLIWRSDILWSLRLTRHWRCWWLWVSRDSKRRTSHGHFFGSNGAG